MLTMYSPDLILLFFMAGVHTLLAEKDCLFVYRSSDATIGNFTSPHFPSNYGEHLRCRYIFEASPDERINITFIKFDLAPGSKAGCVYDYIDIFTVTVDSVLEHKDRVCGGNIPEPLITVHQRVELHFKSYYSTQHTGFLGAYTFINETWQPFPPSDPRCGPDFIMGVGGVLTSPGYPEPYPPHIECTWMIKVERDTRIILNFLVLDMGQSVICSTTYLAMYDGFADPKIAPTEKVCGQLYFYNEAKMKEDKLRKEFKGKTFRLVLRFKSNERESDGSTGFKIAWTAVKLPEIKQLPSGELVHLPCEDFHCLGGEYCIDSSQLLCNALQRFCISSSLTCNGVPNCGAYDHSDEDGCVTRYVLMVTGVIGPILLIISIIAGYRFCKARRKRYWEKKKAKASNDGTNTQISEYEDEMSHTISFYPGSYHYDLDNIYTAVPPSERTILRHYDTSPSVKRHNENGYSTTCRPSLTHLNNVQVSLMLPPQCDACLKPPDPVGQYGVDPDTLNWRMPVTESMDTDQEYISSGSNYASPASLRYHPRPPPPVSYRGQGRDQNSDGSPYKSVRGSDNVTYASSGSVSATV